MDGQRTRRPPAYRAYRLDREGCTIGSVIFIEAGDDEHATGQARNIASAVERGGLVRHEPSLPNGMTAKQTYQRGARGSTIAVITQGVGGNWAHEAEERASRILGLHRGREADSMASWIGTHSNG